MFCWRRIIMGPMHADCRNRSYCHTHCYNRVFRQFSLTFCQWLSIFCFSEDFFWMSPQAISSVYELNVGKHFISNSLFFPLFCKNFREVAEQIWSMAACRRPSEWMLLVWSYVPHFRLQVYLSTASFWEETEHNSNLPKNCVSSPTFCTQSWVTWWDK
jgi:hypothetical protein